MVGAFLTTSTVVSLMSVAIGIWPSLICTVGLTAISLIRLPVAIFNHLRVTFQTSNMSVLLKVLSLTLCPIHLLVPPMVFITSLCALVPTYTVLSYMGYPLKPWKEIASNHKSAWKWLGTVPEIPENWGE